MEIQELLYSVVHTLNEKRRPLANVSVLSQLWVISLIFIDFLSILQIITSSNAWPASYHVSFSPVGLINSTQAPALIFTLYSLDVAVAIFVVCASIYVGISFARKHFISYLPAILLRMIMGTVVTALLVPMLEILVHPFGCLTADVVTLSDSLCSQRVGLSVLSGITILTFVPLAAATQIFYIDNHPMSTDLESCYSGHSVMLDTVMRTIATFLIGVERALPTGAAGMLIVAAMMAYLAIIVSYTLPYYKMLMNCFRCSLYCVISYISIVSFILTVAGNNESNIVVDPTAFFACSPFVLALGILLPLYRKRQLMRYLPAILQEPTVDEVTTPTEADPVASQCLTKIGTLPLKAAHAKSLFPDSEITVVLLATFALHESNLPANLRDFVQATSVDNAEKVFTLGLTAFPQSATVRISFANFINVIHMDSIRSTGMIEIVDKTSATFEDRFWLYSLHKTWESQRQSSELGHSRQLNALSLAEFAQSSFRVTRLHEQTIEHVRKLWALLDSEQYEVVLLLASVQKISDYYCRTVEAYESIISKSVKSSPKTIELMRQYRRFITEVTFDEESGKSLDAYIESAAEDRQKGEDAKSRRSGFDARTGDNMSLIIGSNDFVFNAFKYPQLRLKRMQLSNVFPYRPSKYVTNAKLMHLAGILLACASLLTGISLHFYDVNIWFNSIYDNHIASQLPSDMVALYDQIRDLSLAAGSQASFPSDADLESFRDTIKTTVSSLSNSTAYLTNTDRLAPALHRMWFDSSLEYQDMLRPITGTPALRTNSSTNLYDLLNLCLSNAFQVADQQRDIVNLDNTANNIPLQFVLNNQDTLYSELWEVTLELYSHRSLEIIAENRLNQYVILAITSLLLCITWFIIFWPVIRFIKKIEDSLHQLAQLIPRSVIRRALKHVTLEKQRSYSDKLMRVQSMNGIGSDDNSVLEEDDDASIDDVDWRAPNMSAGEMSPSITPVNICSPSSVRLVKSMSSLSDGLEKHGYQEDGLAAGTLISPRPESVSPDISPPHQIIRSLDNGIPVLSRNKGKRHLSFGKANVVVVDMPISKAEDSSVIFPSKSNRTGNATTRSAAYSRFLIRNSCLMLLSLLFIIMVNSIAVYITYNYPQW